MTATALEAPELAVNCWFNTDRPLNLAGLRGRVVALIAFQALCPAVGRGRHPAGEAHP